MFESFAAVSQSDDLFEGRPEANVDHGVNKRVDHGGGVAQPNEGRFYGVAETIGLAAHRRRHVRHEKGGPHGHESHQDETQHLRADNRRE